ncbi:hypothetical protein RGQ29_003152 [Quercus rubra]|nr:hypothetical protein RGQ29_003152 [Quercus rubra]
MYSEDILKRLSLKLSGNLETSVLLWMPDPVERDLQVVKQGLRLETENLQAATEVICSRTPSQIQSFKQQYLSKFEVHLEDDIDRQPLGHHRELLLAYVRQRRDEDLRYDTERAQEDSRALLGADECTFIRIFSERSRAQLAVVISAYSDLSGNSLEKAVKGKKWGPFGDALRTILSCSESPATYFAKVLHKAMKCLRVDHTTLIRVIVTRTEIDMKDIKAEYLTRYGKTLNDVVDLQTTGHYRTFLLSLLGPNC